MDPGFKEKRPPHPRDNANLFETLTFGWTFNLFKTGKKRDLEVNDLYTTLDTHASAILGNKLEKKWKMELIKAKKAKRQPSLLRALIQMFGPAFLYYGIFRTITEIVLSAYQPFCLGRVIAQFDPDTPSDKTSHLGIFYGTCLLVTTMMKIFSFTAYDMLITHLGMKMRVATCNLIYNKVLYVLIPALLAYGCQASYVPTYSRLSSCFTNLCFKIIVMFFELYDALRLSKTAIGETTIGQVVNLLSNDVNRFDIAIVLVLYVFIGPLETIVVTYFLWQEIGVSAIFGIGVILIFIPLQGWLGKKSSELRLKTAIRTDERVRLMNEIISGIQVIKMYTWEKPFAYLVQFARKDEIQYVKGATYVRAIFGSFTTFHTRLALFFSICTYVLLGNFITAQKVFVVTSYFTILRMTMTAFFPQGIGQMAELLVSVKRLQNFLLYEEKKSQVANRSKVQKEEDNSDRKEIKINGNVTPTNLDSQNNIKQSCDIGIVISNATAKWTDAQTDNSLENINLNVRPGRLVAVIGPVGSGKSSLIQAILRELPLSDGNISVCGVISYASQEPWLFSSSVQQNILFGSPMDKERYDKIINVCALRTDFEQFPYGDKTLVGERGVQLSGGQKARINLARAVYKQADIYLLDDPLSAVDTHVGKHLFEKCIKGFLKEKTCILITHQLQYLTKVDQIILMQNANIIGEGSYQELQASGLDFTKLLRSSAETIVSDNESNPEYTNTNTLDLHTIFSRQISIQSVGSSIGEKILSEPIEVAECRTSGDVSVTVYSSYFSAGGNFLKVSFLLFICIFTQVLASGGDYWITFWVNLEENIFRYTDNGNNILKAADNTTLTINEISDTFLWWTISRKTCIIVFTVITLCVILATLVRSTMFVLVCMKASLNLHNNMFNAITRATMYFFNTNSSGRILNRFSKDMGAIDELLPSVFMDTVQIGLSLSGIIIVIGLVNIYLMIPLMIVGIVFYYLRVLYLATSRSVKRLEGVTRSPVFAHLSASLQGLTTIRAFGAEEILSKEFDNHQDLHSSAWYLFIASSRAFGFWLDLVCLVYIGVVIFSFYIAGNNFYGGDVGLAITQAIGLAGMFQWGMRQSAELENQMTSVERVLEYTNIPQESAFESSEKEKPPKEWPHKGDIVFKNFYLRYSQNTPHVLKNLNIHIKSTEKVGIVGRTGAGKSSLIGALFRLAHNEGSIFIDDIDINNLGLHELRSKISIIPQEPVLFSGTMRTNLDPFKEYSDNALWNALEEVELKQVVKELPGCLNSKMSEGGFNLSVGQRQLVCLARAIVRSNKILVLDEATANVDAQTDALIQNTIRNKFRNCTVLTIAHRLNTVMDSDKLLVMDGGKMVEFDHPYNLLKNKNGYLYKMVQQTGQATCDALHSVAAKSYKMTQLIHEPQIKFTVEDVDALN